MFYFQRLPMNFQGTREKNYIVEYVSLCRYRNPVSLGDYATSFVKVKHVHSMYRALEQSGKRFKRLPEILFVYLAPQRNTKKGELFDVPLRLEMSNFLDVIDEPHISTHTNRHTEDYVPFTGSSPIQKGTNSFI
jgi:hypothetical protein